MERTRRGKTGGSDRVRVGSIGFVGQKGHGSKRVIFKRVNRVAGQTDQIASRVELTRIFQTIFFFFLNRCNLLIIYEFLNYD